MEVDSVVLSREDYDEMNYNKKLEKLNTDIKEFEEEKLKFELGLVCVRNYLGYGYPYGDSTMMSKDDVIKHFKYGFTHMSILDFIKWRRNNK